MCITYCHRRNILYWDHEDCHPAQCELVRGPHRRCADCRHRREAICRLTNASLPESKGCCHYNVEVVHGPQLVTPEMLQLLQLDPDETVIEALEGRNVKHHLERTTGIVLIDPDELPVPTSSYGRGTDHQVDETFDWSDWFKQWGGDGEPTLEAR